MGQPHGAAPDDVRRPRPPEEPYELSPYAQRYPALGYAPDGTPRFQPGPLPEHKPRRPEPDEPPAPPKPEEPKSLRDRIPRVSSTAVMMSVLALGLVVILVAAFSVYRDRSEQAAEEIPVYTAEPDARPDTFDPPRASPENPGAPGQSTPRAAPAGKAVVYEATIDGGSASIIYVDDAGIRFVGTPPNKWSVSFTGGDKPLRLLVIAGAGTAATCSITVDGKPVVDDKISGDSTRRTASCLA